MTSALEARDRKDRRHSTAQQVGTEVGEWSHEQRSPKRDQVIQGSQTLREKYPEGTKVSKEQMLEVIESKLV